MAEAVGWVAVQRGVAAAEGSAGALSGAMAAVAAKGACMHCNHSLNCMCQSSRCSQRSTYWQSSNLPKDRGCSTYTPVPCSKKHAQVMEAVAVVATSSDECKPCAQSSSSQ